MELRVVNKMKEIKTSEGDSAQRPKEIIQGLKSVLYKENLPNLLNKEDFVLDDGSRENESSLKSTEKSRENVAQSWFEEMKITPKLNYEPFLSDSWSKDSKLYDIGEEARENWIKMLNYHRYS